MKANWGELMNKPKWWDEVINKSEDSCTYGLDDTSKTITINSSQGSYEEWVYNSNLPPKTITIDDNVSALYNPYHPLNDLYNTPTPPEEIFYPLANNYQPKKYEYFPEDYDEIYEITATALDAGAGRVSRIIPVGGSIHRDSDTHIYTIEIHALNVNKDIRVELKYSEKLLCNIIHQSFEADSTASLLEDVFYEDIYVALLAEFQKAFNDEKCS